MVGDNDMSGYHYSLLASSFDIDCQDMYLAAQTVCFGKCAHCVAYYYYYHMIFVYSKQTRQPLVWQAQPTLVSQILPTPLLTHREPIL